MRFIVLATAILALAALLVSPAAAAKETLTHANSVFQLDPYDDAGATVWSLDGVNHLFTQQWYYQLNTAAGVLPINTLGQPAVTNTGRDLRVLYSLCGFEVELGYHLTGGMPGSMSSTVSEHFRINNFGSTPLQFTLWQYSDFNLIPLPADDTAALVNNQTVMQWDYGHTVTEVVSRVPDRWQVSGPFTITGDLTNASMVFGPADCAWAFQWNLVVDPGRSIVFSKDKTFSPGIPEPMSVLLGTIGLATVAGLRRFRGK